MIPYDIDPSLHDMRPQPEQLDDGFSPPQPEAAPVLAQADAAEVLGEKSHF